jgi:hypothetical protein
MDRRPTLPVADILGAGRQEWSWGSALGAGCLRPVASDRSPGLGDLSMASQHIIAPARLQKGRRAAQPGGTSTPMVRDPGELLSRTYSGSSARVDYRRRLELNTQDSDEDVLFLQEMRYPERGARGFSNLRPVGGGENRDSCLCSCWRSRSIRQRLSRPLNKVGADAEGVQRTGSALAARRSEQVPTTGGTGSAGKCESPLWEHLTLGG